VRYVRPVIETCTRDKSIISLCDTHRKPSHAKYQPEMKSNAKLTADAAEHKKTWEIIL